MAAGPAGPRRAGRSRRRARHHVAAGGTLHLVAEEDRGWLHGLTRHLTERASRRRRAQLGVEPSADAALLRALDDGPLDRAGVAAALAAAGVRADGQRTPHLLATRAARGELVLRLDGRYRRFDPPVPATAMRRSPRSPADTCAATTRPTRATSRRDGGWDSATFATGSARSRTRSRTPATAGRPRRRRAPRRTPCRRSFRPSTLPARLARPRLRRRARAGPRGPSRWR